MKHTIELNGKQYNALSGEYIDGTNASKTESSQQVATHSARSHLEVTVITPSQPRRNSHLSHHKAIHSRTLMRSTVKKPVIKHTSATTRLAHIPVVTIAKIHNDSSRIARISKIPKSSLISRFGSLTGSSTYSHQG